MATDLKEVSDFVATHLIVPRDHPVAVSRVRLAA
jgi:hypothetical protein